jgi:hypothetical protein
MVRHNVVRKEPNRDREEKVAMSWLRWSRTTEGNEPSKKVLVSSAVCATDRVEKLTDTPNASAQALQNKWALSVDKTTLKNAPDEVQHISKKKPDCLDPSCRNRPRCDFCRKHEVVDENNINKREEVDTSLKNLEVPKRAFEPLGEDYWLLATGKKSANKPLIDSETGERMFCLGCEGEIDEEGVCVPHIERCPLFKPVFVENSGNRVGSSFLSGEFFGLLPFELKCHVLHFMEDGPERKVVEFMLTRRTDSYLSSIMLRRIERRHSF